MSHCFLKSPLQCHANKGEITFEQYSRIHLQGPKIAICETASNVVFVLNSSFTSKDQYFCTAFQEATDAFNNMLKGFGYTQKLELYDPIQHQTHPPSQNSLSIISITQTSTYFYFTLQLHFVSKSFIFFR